jgi:TRAP-type C4-dicarboxylate transport system substrate-binding protein
VGFRPVPLSINDLLPGLQTGMVNGFNATPLVSLAFQWFGLAPNMIDLRWAFLSGATVVEKKAWEKIPADIREKLLEASRTFENRLQEEVRRLNEEAIKVMVKNGLKIHNVSPDVKEQWRKMVENVYPKVRGLIVPADSFDAVKKFRDEYRAGETAGKGGSK